MQDMQKKLQSSQDDNVTVITNKLPNITNSVEQLTAKVDAMKVAMDSKFDSPDWWYATLFTAIMSSTQYKGDGLAATVAMLADCFKDDSLDIQQADKVTTGMFELSSLIKEEGRKGRVLTPLTLHNCVWEFLPDRQAGLLAAAFKVTLRRLKFMTKSLEPEQGHAKSGHLLATTTLPREIFNTRLK